MSEYEYFEGYSHSPEESIKITGDEYFETSVHENGKDIVVKPKWISVQDRLPNRKKVLAIFVSDKGVMYNMRHDGWFRDTIYTCRMHEGKFIIESHGPEMTATHWLPLPSSPEEEQIPPNEDKKNHLKD